MVSVMVSDVRVSTGISWLMNWQVIYAINIVRVHIGFIVGILALLALLALAHIHYQSLANVWESSCFITYDDA